MSLSVTAKQEVEQLLTPLPDDATLRTFHIASILSYPERFHPRCDSCWPADHEVAGLCHVQPTANEAVPMSASLIDSSDTLQAWPLALR